MTKTTARTIEIPEPKFYLYDFVTLYWKDKVLKTRIVECRFELGTGSWTYQVAGSEHFYPSGALEPRYEDDSLYSKL